MHAEFLGLGLYVVTALGEAIESFLVDLLPIGTKKLESAMFTRDLGLIAQRLDLLARSEEHTSELQSLMRISYAVFCLKKNTTSHNILHNHTVVNLNIITDQYQHHTYAMLQ